MSLCSTFIVTTLTLKGDGLAGAFLCLADDHAAAAGAELARELLLLVGHVDERRVENARLETRLDREVSVRLETQLQAVVVRVEAKHLPNTHAPQRYNVVQHYTAQLQTVVVRVSETPAQETHTATR